MRIVVECTVEYTYVFDTVFVNGLKPLADVFNGECTYRFFAAAILSRKGYKVYELDKGFIGWKEAGKETEK